MVAEDPFWTRLPKAGEGMLRGIAESATDPTTMAARLFCLQVLGSEPIAGVSFELPFCKIVPEIFMDVRTAILRGAISTRIMGDGDPDAVGQAVFIPGDDVMKILEGDWWKRSRFVTTVVHEAVHAHHDMSGRADLLVVESEQAAYVAECVFTRRWKHSKFQHRPQFLCDQDNAEYNAIFKPAWELALRIVDQEETSIGKGDKDLQELHDAIRTCSLYKANWDQTITADGLRW